MEVELSINDIKELLKQNKFKRNQDLNGLIRLLNYSRKNRKQLISLDGAWGSGKTYLIKELESLWQLDENDYRTFCPENDGTVSDFVNHCIPFYYNAWENDYSDNPVQSLLLALDDYLHENKTIYKKSERQLLSSVDVKSFIKNISHDLIDFSETPKTIKTYADKANLSKKLQVIIKKTLDHCLSDSDSTFLFIIDDLDRCNPVFAVKMIEAIKHCFLNTRVVFLVATNLKELSAIISGYYGGKIDGDAYLDRIFDFRANLSTPDIKLYIQTKLTCPDSWSPPVVAKHLKLSMREANRYADVINLLDDYFNSSHSFWGDPEEYKQMCYKYVFLPLFLGYKIKNGGIFNKIADGDGFDYIKEFIKLKEVSGFIRSPSGQKTLDGGVSLENKVKGYYDDLFSNNLSNKADADIFWRIVDLTSGYLSF